MKYYKKNRKRKPHTFNGYCDRCKRPVKLCMASQRIGSKYNPYLCVNCAVADCFKFLAIKVIEGMINQEAK